MHAGRLARSAARKQVRAFIAPVFRHHKRMKTVDIPVFILGDEPGLRLKKETVFRLDRPWLK